MKRLVSVISFCLIYLSTLYAETKYDTISKDSTYCYNLSNRAFGVGFGKEKHHVSYLSPLLYQGRGMEFWYENIKPHFKKNKFYSLLSDRVDVALMMPLNESWQMESYYDVFEYHYFYDLKAKGQFHFLCGVYSGFEFGTDMMLSNSNNPIYIRGELNLLGLSLRPTLCIQTKRRLIKLSDQFDFRLAGITFSPTYTQLYYDLSLKDYDKSEFFDLNSLPEKVRFANKLMAEIPLKKMTLRVGMLAERSKSMINMIDNRTTNVQALLGFSFDYIHLSGRLKKENFQECINKNIELKTVFE